MEFDYEKFFQDNYSCFDRFTFDRIFKKLLEEGFDHEDAKDSIMNNCALSALVLQERIHNNNYECISLNDKISDDLLQLKNEILNDKLKKDNQGN